MEQKLRVGILGATGMVGQRFISLLEKCRKNIRGSSRRTLENGYSNAGSSEKARCDECK